MTKEERKFIKLTPEFLSVFQALSKGNKGSPGFTWEAITKALEKTLLPVPPINFMWDPMILTTQSGGNWGNLLIPYLENYYSQDFLHSFLHTEFLGQPNIINHTYYTSHNDLQMLFHLTYYQEKTSKSFSDFNYILDWGGGYGNFAKIIKKFMTKPFTFVLVDTPIMSSLAWIYLASIFGKSQVNLITQPPYIVKAHKLNLTSINHASFISFAPDLFISTWALSEASPQTQQFVYNSDFFNASSLLLAFQKSDLFFPDANLIGDYAVSSGATLYPVPFLPQQNSTYAFL